MISIPDLLSKLNSYQYDYAVAPNFEKQFSQIHVLREPGQFSHEDGVIFIIQSSDLSHLFDYLKSSNFKNIGLFIICDCEYGQNIYIDDSIVFFSSTTNPEKLFKDCIKIFNSIKKITRAQQSITKALIENKDTEYILNVASHFVENPIVLLSVSTDLLAASNIDLLVSFDDDALQDALSRGYASYDKFKQYNMSVLIDTVSKSPSPYLLDTSFGEKMNRLFMRISIEGRILAFLAIQGITRPFNDEDYHIIQFLAKVLSVKLRLNDNHVTLNDMAIENMIIDLIQNKFNSLKTFEDRAKSFGWKLNNSFFVLAVTHEHNECDNNNFELLTLQRYIKELLPSSCKTVYYDNKIIILIDLTDTISLTNDIHQIIVDFLEENNLIAGLSSCFTNILDFSKYYTQSINILNLGIRLRYEGCLYNYEDFYFYNMFSLLEKAHDLRDFCLPQVMKLIKHDRENNSNLLHTLSIYLESGKDVSESSDRLYIHKNTLRYRLTKISEVMQMDIKSGDDLSKLYISLKIIEMLNSK